MASTILVLIGFALTADATDEEPEVITVEGRSVGKSIEDSAKAVTVIETSEAQERAADLGEVLARTQGVGVQRTGGLGSPARLSLNGLTDDQIRFFIDGVPLEIAGFPFGLANVPVNIVDRVEVYRGVVPEMDSAFEWSPSADADTYVLEMNCATFRPEDNTHWLYSSLGHVTFRLTTPDTQVVLPQIPGLEGPAGAELRCLWSTRVVSNKPGARRFATSPDRWVTFVGVFD
ncbi:MAG: TonB-dependent receptor plug domain-containing protein [Myxococcota bacterium]